MSGTNFFCRTLFVRDFGSQSCQAKTSMGNSMCQEMPLHHGLRDTTAACSPDFFFPKNTFSEIATYSSQGKLTEKILKFIITWNTSSNYTAKEKNRCCKAACQSSYSYKEVGQLFWTELTVLISLGFLSQLQTTI